jgi:hypothetical protein
MSSVLAPVRTAWQRGSGRGERWALASLTLLAAALRAPFLGFQPVWNDEAYSLALAQRDFGQMLHLFKFEANGVLYELVVWPFVQLGQSPELLRAPALVAGVLAVPALWWAARERSPGKRARTAS